jgi:hypothetical protein
LEPDGLQGFEVFDMFGTQDQGFVGAAAMFDGVAG